MKTIELTIELTVADDFDPQILKDQLTEFLTDQAGNTGMIDGFDVHVDDATDLQEPGSLLAWIDAPLDEAPAHLRSILGVTDLPGVTFLVDEHGVWAQGLTQEQADLIEQAYS